MDRAPDLIGVALIAAVATIALVVLSGTSSPKPASSSPSAGAPDRIPACADVRAAGDTQISCRTRRARIELVRGSRPLVLQDVQVRLLRAERSARGLQVRLRLRNTSERAQSFSPSRRQVYLSVAGRRAFPVAGAGQTIPSQQGITATLRFPEISAGRAIDVGVVPFALLDRSRPSTVGVIHLPAQTAT